MRAIYESAMMLNHSPEQVIPHFEMISLVILKSAITIAEDRPLTIMFAAALAVFIATLNETFLNVSFTNILDGFNVGVINRSADRHPVSTFIAPAG